MLELKKTRGMTEVVDVQPQMYCFCSCNTHHPVGQGPLYSGAQAAGQINNSHPWSDPGVSLD